jgi:hypothetical protein
MTNAWRCMPHTAIKHALRLPLCDTHAHTPPMPTSSCQPTPFPQTHVQSILYTHATKSSAASAAATIGSLLPSRCQPVAVHGCTCEGQGQPNRTTHSGMLDDLPRISTAKSSLLHSCLSPPHTMESRWLVDYTHPQPLPASRALPPHAAAAAAAARQRRQAATTSAGRTAPHQVAHTPG